MVSFPHWLRLLAIFALVCLLGVLSHALYVGHRQPAKAPQSKPVTLAPSLQPPRPSAASATTTILFAGDIMFDRNIRAVAQQHSNDFILAPVRDLLLAQDFVVANLEGPLTSNPSRSLGSVVGSPANYSFTFDPSVADTLYRHNIRVVNLGNNHILNFGPAGLDQTLTNLVNAQVAAFGYTGIVSSASPLAPSYVINHNRQKIALINYNQFTAGTSSQAVALAEIKRLRPKVDWVVMYPHWDNEYQPLAAQVTVQLAHEFVDAGADLIIGSHPHVIQNHELYKGKYIYYSLGNFIFDQYFDPTVRNGLTLAVTFQADPAEITVKEIPVFLNTNGQTQLAK